MQVLIGLIPFVIVLVIYACFVRLAARLIHASQVGWLLSFQFVGIIAVFTIAGRVAQFYLGHPPLLVSLFTGVVLHLLLGAWFFRKRAFASNGQPLGWLGGAKLTSIAVGFLFLLTVVIFGAFYALLFATAP